MKYQIEVKKSVFKVFKQIPRDDQIKIVKKIRKLAAQPRRQNCLKLADSQYYHIRCGQYRIIYEIQEDQLIIVILKVGQQKNVNKRP